MSFFNWLGVGRSKSRSVAGSRVGHRTCRLRVEQLENRRTPASYTAATVPDLVAAIGSANLTAEADTITLVPGSTFTLTQVNNTTNGPTGLPTIAANSGNLSIVGSGNIVERRTATGTPAFRLLDVAAGASLRLENLTLQGGMAFGSGVWSHGGAIHNQGALELVGVTVQNNQALGSRGFDGSFGPSGASWGESGSSAFGGGLYVDGGTTLLTGVTLAGNTARGGDGGNGGNGNHRWEGGRGGNGGNGFGGGLYAAGGAIELHNTTVTLNTAQGGAGGKAGSGSPRGKNGDAGFGIGGGLYIEADVIALLDAFSAAQCKRNKASTSDPNIHGAYTIG